MKERLTERNETEWRNGYGEYLMTTKSYYSIATRQELLDRLAEHEDQEEAREAELKDMVRMPRMK